LFTNDFAQATATTETWALMTAADIDAALTDILGAGADDYGLANSDIVGTNATATVNRVGTTQDSIMMIQNDLNAGEYKVFNVETTAAGGVETFTVALVGTIDFGGEIDANAVFA